MSVHGQTFVDKNKNKKRKNKRKKGEKIMRLEHENDYGTVNGKANAGLTLGIIGTALSALNGGLGNIGVGGVASRAACPEDHFYSRYDASKDALIAELRNDVKLRDANTYTDSKILELYRYVDGKLDGVNAAICAQNVYNATNSAAIGCINNQIAQLAALTKVVIPTTSICPEPMARYNSWVAPTAPATT
jgi:hypothetical protein